VIAWIVASVATTALYLHNFSGNAADPSHGYAIHHPIAALKFFVSPSGTS
jgi:hypothetical protein